MRKALAVAAAVLSLMATLSYPVSATEVEPQPEEKRMMELINLERRNRQLSQLKVNKRLIFVGRDHSIEMWMKDYFDHISPTPELRTPMDRYIHEFGKPKYALVGENLYWSKTARSMFEAHKALMESSTHRENTLDPRWKEIGVGFFETPEHQIYVTVMFVTTEAPKK